MLFKETTFLGGLLETNDRNTDRGVVGGSSPPGRTTFFRLPDVAPKAPTHNPTHTYLRSPRKRRSDSWRDEIFYSCRRNHLEPKRITERAPRRRLPW
jgi:hypothetical protein